MLLLGTRASFFRAFAIGLVLWQTSTRGPAQPKESEPYGPPLSEWTDLGLDSRIEQLNRLIEKGDLAGGIEKATEVIQLFPNDPQAFIARHRARWRKGDYSGALADIDRALQLDPNDGSSYASRGFLKAVMGDNRGAILDFDRALSGKDQAASADAPALLNGRGNAKLAAGDLEGALGDFDEALRRKPDFVDGYYNRGRAWATKKDRAKAIADFSRCIQLRPDLFYPYLNRASVQLAEDNFAGAVRDIETAIKLSPRNLENHRVYSQILQKQGKFAEAVKELDRVIAEKPAFPVYAARGRLRALQGDFRGALADYDNAKEDKPVYDRFFHYTVARRLGVPDAVEPIRKLLPQWPEGWAKSVALYLAGQLAEKEFFARAEKGSANAISEQRCEANFYVGMTRLCDGKNEEAAEFFRQSIATGQTTFVEFQFAQAELKRMSGLLR